MNKDFQFSNTAIGKNVKRLTNQIFKLLPMYENGEDWKLQSDNILRELHGYNKILKDDANFMNVVAKLLILEDLNDPIVFRKTIFEAITELQSIKDK